MGETDNPMQAVITKCGEDEAFKERLLADPAATLKAEGVKVPEGVIVNVAVDAEDVRTLAIPLPPIGALSDGELTAVTGGLFFLGAGFPTCSDLPLNRGSGRILAPPPTYECPAEIDGG